MTTEKALDLALEALEHMLEDAKQERLTVEYWNECVDAITAIKQARALDKKAENARELGLDYEPVPENFIDALKFDVAMREWVGLTPHERMMCRSYDIDTTIDKTEAKLKEKNT